MKVFVETSHALPLVSVLIAFRSGSAHDPEGRDGLTRVVARMLRRGADGWSALAIESAIDSLGGELSADASPSATSVHFEVIRRSLDPFADLVATLLAKPSFDGGELDKLKREAKAEIVEARDSDRALCSRAFRKTVFGGHPYGRRVAGTIPSIGSITRDDVRRHYERHFVRQNAIVAISGDIDEEGAHQVASRLLAGLPRGDTVPDVVAPPQIGRGRRLVFVDKPDRTQTQMALGGLGTDAHDPDHTALLVANTAFGGTFTSRMMREIRSKRGWSYGAYSRVAFDRQRDAFSMWTAPAATDAPACLGLELDLLSEWRRGGISAEELGFVQSYLIRSHAFEIDTPRKRVHQRLEASLYDLPLGYHEHYLDRVRATTLEQANTAVRARISDEDLVVAVVGTRSEIGDRIAAAIPNLESVTVLPFDFE